MNRAALGVPIIEVRVTGSALAHASDQMYVYKTRPTVLGADAEE
jgi:hypothetical protein